MERNTFQLIGTNIYGFIIIAMLGVIYYSLNDKGRKIIIFLLVVFNIVLLYKFIPNYIIKLHNKIEYKLQNYKLDKAAIIYSYLGESVIFPPANTVPVLWLDGFGLDDFNEWTINNYFDPSFFGYTFYHNYKYKHKLIGYQFKDAYYADEQLNKRIKFFTNPNSKKSKFFFPIKFSDLNEIDNKYLTLEEIEKKEKIFGQDDIFLKVKAYIYYRDKNYEEALKFYKLYLSNYPDDYDALINIGKIYKEKRELQSAENIYKKLVQLDNYNCQMKMATLKANYEQQLKSENDDGNKTSELSNSENKYLAKCDTEANYLFNFLLMEVFYEEGNYIEALKINNKLINLKKGLYVYNYMVNLYLNQAILYNAMNNSDKTKEYITKVREMNPDKAEEYENLIRSNEKIQLIHLARDIVEQF